VCDIDFLTPADLTFEQTDQSDPNPGPQITLREWHLTATTPEKQKRMEFVTLYRPRKLRDSIGGGVGTLRSIPGGYVLSVELAGKKLTALLPTDDNAVLREPDGLTTKGTIKLKLEGPGAQPPQILEVRQGDLR